jgi:type IV pilus assembly protein PilX
MKTSTAYVRTYTRFSRGTKRRQQGVALIMALVILMILTILGVTAMSTSVLGEKMSGNIQESTKSFEAAESGIKQALTTDNFLNPNGTSTTTFDYYGKKSGYAQVESTFLEYTPPKRSKDPTKIYSATNLQAAHFDIKSTGLTLTNAKTKLHQGYEIVVPKSE